MTAVRERTDAEGAQAETLTPLCVDLDGTLVRTDLLLEAMVLLVRQNPLNVFRLPLWLAQGKAAFKQQIADRVNLEPQLLPYSERLLAFLRGERAKGRRLVLTTAANAKYAEQIAAHLGLFDEVWASDARTNLAGRRKLERMMARFGDRGFDYAGNALVDVPVWRHAAESIVVNAPWLVCARARTAGNVTQIVRDPRGHPLHVMGQALRVHQWIKNGLLLVPLLLAHRATELALARDALVAAFAFCLCASSVYVLNDLVDLPSDRRHPSKRNRPFASGRLAIHHAFVMVPVLLAAAFALAATLPVAFVAALAIYFSATLAYTFRLKRAVLIDVLLLAGLYTWRIVAGGAAVTIVPSFWLLAFSMFLFLSLAMAKRYVEVDHQRESEGRWVAGRGYQTGDLTALGQFGISSAYIAVLVLALYINSDTVTNLYSRPPVLWLLCPLVLYLVSRIWLLAQRGRLDEDPVVFAISDRNSLLVVAIGAVLLWLAS